MTARTRVNEKDKLMKKTIPIILPIILLFALASCNSADISADISMYDLQKTMLAADETFPDMLTVSSDDSDAKESFAYLSDMDYGKVDKYFLAYSSAGKADEIAVVLLKDENDVAEIKASLEAHREKRVKVYENYLPEETSRAENALIFTEGKFAVLIISDNAQSVKKAFETEACG